MSIDAKEVKAMFSNLNANMDKGRRSVAKVQKGIDNAIETITEINKKNKK